jgi:PAS domain S-box-containing protein
MEAGQTPALKGRPRKRLLLRGESLIASVGLSLAALLLFVMTASMWWTLHVQQSALNNTRRDQLKAVGDMLARSAELLTPQGDLTAVRRMVADAARANGLATCRIVLPDGGVLASAKPSEANVHVLPEDWPSSKTIHSATAGADGVLIASVPITLTGRGSAQVVLTAPPPTITDQWEAAVGACGICLAALIMHLVLYRRARRRLRAVGAVHEALSALSNGEAAIESMIIAADLGPEAQAWNRLVEEACKMRRQGAAERAREALSRRPESSSDLDTACDALTQGLVLLDDKCRVRYTNGAAAVLLSAKREEMSGKELGNFLQVESVLAAARDIATGAARRRTVHDVERREDGPASVLRFIVRPVRRDDSGAAIITIEDITQQRVAEEARSRFVAQATHELRTPLTNIRLYVETAIDDGQDDPVTRAKCLNVINGETRRLERIVGEMLSVAEIEAGSFEVHYDDVRLDQLFDELKVEYQQQAEGKKIKLSFNLPPKLPVMQGDRDKMLMALHNLVGNALKYTPAGGKVDVVVTADDAQVMVQVKDTGIGISDSDQTKIFDRFYRAKDPRVTKITGTGLGLTLAREVVRLHGGDINVESKLDQGSTFTLKVPVQKKAA